MAEFRAIVAGLGYRDVRTLLNSGNVLFQEPRGVRGDPASRIEQALLARLGLVSRVLVLTASQLAQVVKENSLATVADNPSRLMVSLLYQPADRARLKPLTRDSWEPEALALGGLACYLWCPAGILESPLSKAGRVLGDATTVRNWATISKLHQLLEGQ
jgi:uncharacterized protein (DUF1697 family)